MNWHEQNANFNALIKQIFHDLDETKRAEAARQLGFLRDGRSVNLLCKALVKEQDPMVLNRIIEALGLIGDARATLGIVKKLKEETEKKEINSDKLKITFILESLMRLKDKRALPYISPLLNSSDTKLRLLVEKAFDAIEPRWRAIVEEEQRKKSVSEIFKS
jgi:HEAT repeat protein